MTRHALATSAAVFAAATVAPTPYVLPSDRVEGPLPSHKTRLGEWLLQGEDLFVLWRRRLASQSPVLAFGELADVPERATWFVYGTGVKVQALYDRAHGLVLYHQGCCAWDEIVLARAPASPEALVGRDLLAFRTRHGIGLGASAADVVAAYGPAHLHRSTKIADLRVLSYWRDQHVKGSGCAWFENFVFRGSRLIEI
jgi:hypothetical protein